MTAKTKKYKLETNLYLKIAMTSVLKEYWWVWFIPFVILLLPIVISGAFWWCFSIALILSIGYLIFWGIQFVGLTQLPQAKQMFEPLYYEVDNRQILMKVNQQMGMAITWDKIQKVQELADAYLLFISRGQFIHLPFHIFKTDNDRLFMEGVLRRKNLIPKAKTESKTTV